MMIGLPRRFRAQPEATAVVAQEAAMAVETTTLNDVLYASSENMLAALENHYTGADEEDLLNDNRFNAVSASVVSPLIDHAIRTAAKHNLHPDENFAARARLIAGSIASVQRVQELTDRTAKGFNDDLDIYGQRRLMKVRQLAPILDSASRSRIASTVASDAVEAIARHTYGDNDTKTVSKKITNYLELAEAIVPARDVNPAQAQVRRAAGLMSAIIQGRGTTVTEVTALARQAQRLMKQEQGGPALLPADDVAQLQKLRSSLARFTTSHPSDSEAVQKIAAALIDIDPNKSEATLPIVPTDKEIGAKELRPITPGGANDTRLSGATAKVKIIAGGDKGQYSVWVRDPARLARSAAAGALITTSIAGLASPSVAAADTLQPTALSQQGGAFSPNLLKLPAAPAAPQIDRSFGAAVTLDVAAQTETLPTAVTDTRATPSQPLTLETTPALPPQAQTLATPVINPPATVASPNFNAVVQVPADAAPVPPAITSFTGPLTVPDVAPVTSPLPNQLASPAAPGNTLTTVTDVSTQSTDETAPPANNGTLSLTNLSIDTPNSNTYTTVNNMPASVDLASARQLLNNTISSGGSVSEVASAMQAVLAGQIANSGDSLTNNPNFNDLYQSTLQVANSINPTADTPMRQAAFAVVLSQHPELLADPGTVKQIQDAFDVSNPVFTNAYIKWLNNQNGTPANINVGTDNTNQLVMINKLLGSAMTTNMSAQEQQAWLDQHDIQAALQNRTQHLAGVTLASTVTKTAPAPATPPKPAPVIKPVTASPPPAAKQPNHNTAPKNTQEAYLQAAKNLANLGPDWVNRSKVMTFFIGKGFTPTQAAGIAGNWGHESADERINTTQAQFGGGPGRGMAQWSVNGRWVNLLSFCKTMGLDPNSLEGQMEFAWHEMTTDAPWNQTPGALKQTTSLQDAVAVFEEYYEKAGAPALASRGKYAQDALDAFSAQYANVIGAPVSAITPKAPPAPAQTQINAPMPSAESIQAAKNLLNLQNTAIKGSNAVFINDVNTIASGHDISNQNDTHNVPTSIDPRLLELDSALNNAGYNVVYWNAVTGHGYDTHEHPRGKAEDIGSVFNRNTGVSTNFQPGTPGFNLSEAIKFREVLSQLAPAGSWLGQGDYPGYSNEQLASDTSTGPDKWNHQHIELSDPNNPNG